MFIKLIKIFQKFSDLIINYFSIKLRNFLKNLVIFKNNFIIFQKILLKHLEIYIIIF